MKALPHHLATLLRQISEGRKPTAKVKLASTSWWFGDLSVTREINSLRKLRLLRMWRDASRNQYVEITGEGRKVLASSTGEKP